MNFLQLETLVVIAATLLCFDFNFDIKAMKYRRNYLSPRYSRGPIKTYTTLNYRKRKC